MRVDSKHWFTTSCLEEGAGKRCSECVIMLHVTVCENVRIIDHATTLCVKRSESLIMLHVTVCEKV